MCLACVLLDQKPQIHWLKLRSNRTAAFWVQYATNAILVHLKLNPPGTWKSIWQQSCLPSVDATTAASAAAAGSAWKNSPVFSRRQHVATRHTSASRKLMDHRRRKAHRIPATSSPKRTSTAKSWIISRQWSQRSNFTYDSWLIGFQDFHPFFGRIFSNNKYLQHVDGGSSHRKPPMESFPAEAVAAELQDLQLGDMKWAKSWRKIFFPSNHGRNVPKFIPFLQLKGGPGVFFLIFVVGQLPENEKEYCTDTQVIFKKKSWACPPRSTTGMQPALQWRPKQTLFELAVDSLLGSMTPIYIA